MKPHRFLALRCQVASELLHTAAPTLHRALVTTHNVPSIVKACVTCPSDPALLMQEAVWPTLPSRVLAVVGWSANWQPCTHLLPHRITWDSISPEQWWGLHFWRCRAVSGNSLFLIWGELIGIRDNQWCCFCNVGKGEPIRNEENTYNDLVWRSRIVENVKPHNSLWTRWVAEM